MLSSSPPANVRRNIPPFFQRILFEHYRTCRGFLFYPFPVERLLADLWIQSACRGLFFWNAAFFSCTNPNPPFFIFCLFLGLRPKLHCPESDCLRMNRGFFLSPHGSTFFFAGLLIFSAWRPVPPYLPIFCRKKHTWSRVSILDGCFQNRRFLPV